MLKLVKPDVKYKSQIEEVIKEVENNSNMDSSGRWYIEINMDKFEEFIKDKLNQEKGIDLKEGFVSCTTFWVVDEKDKYIGRISLRHKLTEELLKIGGHIGYDVRPSERRKGYCSKMLELCLQEAKTMGLKKVLMTCDYDNVGSKKVIEKNGGKLESQSNYNGKLIRRYWIDLG